MSQNTFLQRIDTTFPLTFEDLGERKCIFTVKVAHQWIALPLQDINNIFQLEAITPVPLACSDVIGLTNIQGKVASVLSLRHFLGYPSLSSHVGSLAIGITYQGDEIALLIDEIGEIILIHEADEVDLSYEKNTPLCELGAVFYKTGETVLPLLTLEAILGRESFGGMPS